MTRLDFFGLLFVNFPIDRPEWTWGAARCELERLIRHNGDTEITPTTAVTAFATQAARRLNNLPPPEIERQAIAAWKDRAERLKSKGVKAAVPRPRFVENGCPERDPLAMRWDQTKRLGVFLDLEAATGQLRKNCIAFYYTAAKGAGERPQQAKQAADAADWSF